MSEKAMPSESAQRQATGLGRIFRGAFATRGASPTSIGSSAPSHRLGLLFLGALVAVFLAVPAAQAVAAGPYTIEIQGTGAGEVKTGEGEFGTNWPGVPPVACSYESPGPAEGACTGNLSLAEGIEAIYVEAVEAEGSEFAGFEVVEGGDLFGVCETTSECLVGHEGETGEPVKLVAYFEAEPAPATGPYTIEIQGTGAGEVKTGEGEFGTNWPGVPPVACSYESPGPAEGACTGNLSLAEGIEAIYVEAVEAEGSEFAGFEVVEGGDLFGVCETTSECLVGHEGETGEPVKLVAYFEAEPAPATGPYTIEIQGTGAGEVKTGEGEFGTNWPGVPRVACSYESPGPAEGACTGNLSLAEGIEAIYVEAVEAEGSEFAGFEVVEGGDLFGVCETTSECLVGHEGETGEPVKLVAYFEAEPAPATGPYTIEIQGTGAGEVKTGEGEFGTNWPGVPPVACSYESPGPAEGACTGNLSLAEGIEAIYVEAVEAEGSEFAGFEVVEGGDLFGVCETTSECLVGHEGETGEPVKLVAYFEAEPAPATGPYTIEIQGTGAGEVKTGEGEFGTNWPGVPPVACSYESPGPAEGACTGNLSLAEGIEAIYVEAVEAEGSEFAGFEVVEGGDLFGVCETTSECLVGHEGETGEPVKLVAYFEAEPAPATGPYTIEIQGTGAGEVKTGEGEFGTNWPGVPPVACSYESPGPAEGACTGNLSLAEGIEAIYVEAVEAEGSEFAGFEVVEGGDLFGVCETTSECLVGHEGETGEPVKLVAYFEAEPAPATGPYTIEIQGTGAGEVKTGEGEFGTNWPGVPPVACSYESPGPAEGACTGNLSLAEGIEAIYVEAVEAEGSEFAGFEVVEGGDLFGVCETTSECLVGHEGETGEPVKLVAYFEAEEGAPTVSGVSPNHGPPNTEVTITGTNLTGATAVKFGTETANSFSVESGTTVKAHSPTACTSGTVDVTVTTPGGTSATSSADHFTCEAPPPPAPTVSGVSPNHGPPNTEVTITGTNLTGATAVKFGTETANSFSVESGTTVKAHSPTACTSGTVDVTVTTPGGTSATSSADHFTCEAPPPVTHTLTINKAGTGTGSVTCDGTACASAYPQGTTVTLAATPAAGSTFYGWSGEGCSGTGTCVVTINADTTVTAAFTKNEEPEPEGTAKAAGTASSKGGKAQIKLTCSGGPCKGSFKLTAKVKQGKKRKQLLIGKASFSLAAGASKTVAVKLSGPAKQELSRGRTLKAQLKGSGVKTSTVKLKPAKNENKRAHKRHRHAG